MRYLQKYKGKYRILAHYDLKTNDFPRDLNGNIDPSFDDLYIPCKKGKIYHYGGSTLVAYIPSLQKGHNIIKKINEINSDIIFDIEESDAEILFKFKAEYIDEVAGDDIMGAKTYGCGISPFSTRNLPKRKYEIPADDLAKYKDIIKDINLKENMNRIRKIYDDFDNVILKHMSKINKEFNISAEKKKRMLKGKEFIYDIGMWDEFIDFLKCNINIV